MAKGITQSFFLHEFVAEIVRTGGAGLAGAGAPADEESVAQVFLDAALAAAHELFGTDTPIAVELSEELGAVQFTQVLEVVEATAEPRRQIALAAMRAAGFEVNVGDTVTVPIRYTHDPGARGTIERLQAQLGEQLPLPVHSPALWPVLTEALNAVLLRYFPAPRSAEGTLAGLLASGGGWTRGCSARSGDFEVTIEGAWFDFYRTRVTSGWVEYGFLIVVRKAGVEVFRGESGYTQGRLGDGPDAPYLAALQRGDNAGNVRSWDGLPTSEAARDCFTAALQVVVDELAGGGDLHSSSLEPLLVAAIVPPVAGGLWAWMQEALPRLLRGFVHTTERDGARVRFEVSEVVAPRVGLMSFGSAAVRLFWSMEAQATGGDCEAMDLGAVGPEALVLRGPVAAEERDLEAIVATYCDWLAAQLGHHVMSHGLAGMGEHPSFYVANAYFPLVELLEQRMAWGPAGDPPVPAWDEAATDRAAGLVRRAEVGDERAIAAFSAGGWTIVLHDDVQGQPFGSYCGISLISPDGGDATQVMMVDAWNPPTRTVIDGDAFAFRRFCEWLRAAIVEAGLDDVVVFANGEGEEGDEDEDYEEEEDEGEIEVMLSDWLLFGLPDDGDRFLVDWRAQWHVVNPNVCVDGFAGIYGFTGERVERLRNRDVVCWRRFLREVLDPRFIKTIGERLLHRA